MRSGRAIVAGCALLVVGGSAAATEHTTVFEKLYHLDARAAEGEQTARQLRAQVRALDAELESRWVSLDVATRAAQPIRNNVTEGLGRWLIAYRVAERETMDGPHAGADTVRLLRYAAPYALPSRLKDVDVVRRADGERTGFVSALARRAQWTVAVARTSAGADAAVGARGALIEQARSGLADKDLMATADDLQEALRAASIVQPDVDFHRRKGTLARPLTMAPTHRFAETAPLHRPTGWTYRAERGAKVHAIGDAKVAFRGVIRGYGLTVVLVHGSGYLSTYAHLDQTLVDVGDEIARATVIAAVGDSGSLDGPRLFFELRKDLEPIDPHGWFLKQ